MRLVLNQLLDSIRKILKNGKHQYSLMPLRGYWQLICLAWLAALPVAHFPLHNLQTVQLEAQFIAQDSRVNYGA